MDYPTIPMPQLLPMNLQMPQLKKGGGMGDMGGRILQAALNQQRPGAGQVPASWPEVGQTIPGGAMNIVPPNQNQAMGLAGMLGNTGLLSKLLGGGGIGGAGAFGGSAGGVTGGLGGLY